MTAPLVEGVANPLTTGVGRGVAGAASGTQQFADLLGDAIDTVCPFSSNTHPGTTHVLTPTWFLSFIMFWGVLPPIPNKAYVLSMNLFRGIVSYCVCSSGRRCGGKRPQRRPIHSQPTSK